MEEVRWQKLITELQINTLAARNEKESLLEAMQKLYTRILSQGL